MKALDGGVGVVEVGGVLLKVYTVPSINQKVAGRSALGHVGTSAAVGAPCRPGSLGLD